MDNRCEEDREQNAASVQVSKRKIDLRCAAMQADALSALEGQGKLMGNFQIQELAKKVEQGYDYVIQKSAESTRESTSVSQSK